MGGSTGSQKKVILKWSNFLDDLWFPLRFGNLQTQVQINSMRLIYIYIYIYGMNIDLINLYSNGILLMVCNLFANGGKCSGNCIHMVSEL